MTTRLLWLILFQCTLLVARANAAPDGENRCQAARSKAWSTYVRCEARVQQRYQMAGAALDGPDFKATFSFNASQCRMKYAKAWAGFSKEARLVNTSCQLARFVDNGDLTVT